MRKQKLPQLADFFYYYFSYYIKVSDGQHSNIPLFKIDCTYQPTDEIYLVKLCNWFCFVFVVVVVVVVVFYLGFTPCKTGLPLLGMELQEKKHKKDYRIRKICLERTYC